MHPIIKTILFALGSFVIFSAITVVLKLMTNHVALEHEYLGFFTKSDLFLGLVVAGVVTLSYEKRKRLKKQ